MRCHTLILRHLTRVFTPLSGPRMELCCFAALGLFTCCRALIDPEPDRATWSGGERCGRCRRGDHSASAILSSPPFRVPAGQRLLVRALNEAVHDPNVEEAYLHVQARGGSAHPTTARAYLFSALRTPW